MDEKNITVVSAVVKDTGWPIDGHRLAFRDPGEESNDFPLYGWEDPDAEAVKLTIWAWLTETGNTTITTFEEYSEKWDAKQPVTDTLFVLQRENLDDIEFEREILPGGITLEPRKSTDKGGILLLPLKKNLKNAEQNHPDWKLIKCPKCGRPCFKFPEAERLELTQGVTLMCTECGIDAGIVRSYGKKNMPHPDGNRAKRRSKNYKALKRMEKATRRKP